MRKTKYPIFLTNRKRKKRRRRIIVRSIIGLLLFPWVVLIVFRNPIVTTISEKGLSTVFDAPVEITDLHIGILKQGFSIQKITIADKYSDTYYFLKTGLIKISYQIAPLFKDNLVSIPEVIFNNFRFNEPMTEKEMKRNKKAQAKIKAKLTKKLANKPINKNAKKEKSEVPRPPIISKDTLDTLIQSIDTESLIKQYTISKQVAKLGKNIDALQSGGKKTLEKSAKTTTNIQKSYNSVSSNLNNASDINALQSNIQKITPLIAQSKNTLGQVQSIKNVTETYAGQIAIYSNGIPQSIQHDTKKVMSQIANPKALGSKILIDILEHIINEKAGKFTSVAFTVLDGLEKTLDTYSNKNNRHFRIGLFKFSAGIGIIQKPLFIIESKNISDRLYTSPEPTEFYIQIGEGRRFTLKGKGGISLHPNAPILLQTNLTYEGVPFLLTNDELDIIEMKSIAGTADGTINIALENRQSGNIEANITSYDLDIETRNGAVFGQSMGKGLEDAAPLIISTTITLENRAITSIAMENNFLEKITDIATQIVKAQLIELTEKIKEQLEQEVEKQIKEQLSVSAGKLTEFTTDVDKEYARIKNLDKKINTLFSETNSKVRTVAQTQAKKLADEVRKKAREAAKKGADEAVENITNSLPSF